MAITQGNTVVWDIPLRDQNGNPLPLEGVSVTSVAASTTGVILFANSISIDVGGNVINAVNMEVGPGGLADGVIVETIPSAQTLLFPAGLYVQTVSVELANGDDYSPIPASILEVKAAGYTPGTLPGLIHGATRRQIRKTVADMLNDYHEGTDLTGGETGSLTDNINFARPPQFFKGMQILFSNPASPSYGHVATVLNSDGPTRTIYFEPPLSVPAIPGESVEMYNHKGRGQRIGTYNNAINAAISQARQQHYVAPISSLSTIFYRTSPYIMIPPEFVYFTGIDTTHSNGLVRSLRPQDYRVDRFSRTVTIRGSQGLSWLHGYYPTLRGMAAPSLLTSDDDTTSIDLEWLHSEVKAQLLERKVSSGGQIDNADRLYLQERNESAGKRSLIIHRAAPNSVRLS